MNILLPPLIPLQSAVRESAAFLASAGVPSPRAEAEILLAHSLGVERIELYRRPERKLNGEEASAFEALIRSRADGVPTAYLRGMKEFYSRIFKVGPGVLIPRADTEIVAEEAMKCFPRESSPRILDLCAGSGALIVTLLAHFAGSRGAAADLSPDALRYARENAAAHGVLERVEFHAGDLFAPLPQGERYDLIVSNPPYVATGEISPDLRFEPRMALDGGEDGLDFYRRILAGARERMSPGAFLILEIGNVSRGKFEKEAGAAYPPPRFVKDLAGRDRAAIFTSGDKA